MDGRTVGHFPRYHIFHIACTQSLTDLFTIILVGPQNLTIDEFFIVQKRQWTVFEALTRWNARSGHQSVANRKLQSKERRCIVLHHARTWNKGSTLRKQNSRFENTAVLTYSRRWIKQIVASRERASPGFRNLLLSSGSAATISSR